MLRRGRGGGPGGGERENVLGSGRARMKKSIVVSRQDCLLSVQYVTAP